MTIENVIKDYELYKQITDVIEIEIEWKGNSKLEEFEIIKSRILYKTGRYEYLIKYFQDEQVRCLLNSKCDTTYQISDRYYHKIGYVNTNKM